MQYPVDSMFMVTEELSFHDGKRLVANYLPGFPYKVTQVNAEFVNGLGNRVKPLDPAELHREGEEKSKNANVLATARARVSGAMRVTPKK